jgi:hypothetical protein
VPICAPAHAALAIWAERESHVKRALKADTAPIQADRTAWSVNLASTALVQQAANAIVGAKTLLALSVKLATLANIKCIKAKATVWSASKVPQTAAIPK